MNPQRTTLIPEIFILWHPQCSLGERLARRIYTWLRPGNGLGPQVFYRSLPAPEAPDKGLPPPLPGESRSTPEASASSWSRVCNLQIILPLIDANMVADPAWRYWLDELSTGKPASVQRVITPVALDATAYNMPMALRRLNYLRPSGLPLRGQDEMTELCFEDVVRSLLKQLTEALCRTMLSRPRDDEMLANSLSLSSDALHKLKIFLSHAKVDGSMPARRLRDYIYSQTQLAAFYDENDIAFGSIFSRVIQDDLDSPDTAALIAVRSERYASRPWCRREMSLFRRPRLEGTPGNRTERWRLFPTVIVDAMEGGQLTAGIPEFGNSSIIRWDDDGKNLEELIVTTAIRDTMLASFHSAMGASIAQLPVSAREASPPQSLDRIILNWLPDPTTLLHLPAVRDGLELDIVHPGRGLSGMELDILGEFFPAITFRSFEEVLL